VVTLFLLGRGDGQSDKNPVPPPGYFRKNFTPFHVLFPYCDDNPCIAMKPAGLFRLRFSPFIRHLPTLRSVATSAGVREWLDIQAGFECREGPCRFSVAIAAMKFFPLARQKENRLHDYGVNWVNPLTSEEIAAL
jgi:hypothetical protein